jgi:Major Facilitator Superfamily
MGSKVYGIYGFSIAGSALLGYGIQLFIINYIGYEGIFFTMGGVTLISIILLKFFFHENNPWKNEIQKNRLLKVNS